MSVLKKLAQQTAVYGLSSIIGRLLNYLLVPVYTRFFLPSEFGVVTEMYAYVAFFVVILTYGMETAFFHFSNKQTKLNKNTVYTTVLSSVFITTVLFCLITIINSNDISGFMGSGIQQNFVVYFAIILSLDALNSIAFSKLRLEERPFRFALVRLLGIITNISLNIFFIVFEGYGIEYIFISNLISSILTTILLVPDFFSYKLEFNFSLWKKMIYYAFPLLVAGTAGIVNETIDRVMLKQIHHPSKTYVNHLESIRDTCTIPEDHCKYENAIVCLKSKTQYSDLPSNLDQQSWCNDSDINPLVENARLSELGLYGAFYKISIIMLLFIQTFRYAAEPFFFNHYKNKNNTEIYANVMKYFVIIMTFLFLISVVFYDNIISFLGEKYHDPRGFKIVSILLLANLFLGVFFNLSIWYKLTGKTIYGAYLSLFGAAITICLNLTLIPKLGIEGSAWATLACYFFMTVVSYFIGRRHFYIPYDIKKILIYIFFMIIIYLLVAFMGFSLVINLALLFLFMIFVTTNEYNFSSHKK